MSATQETPSAKRRVFDAFLYAGEFELLARRVKLHRALVTKFVIIEATTTHSNTKRTALLRDEHPKWLNAHKDRVHYVLVDDLKHDPESRWVAENDQRSRIGEALRALGAAPNDVVVVSDLDEIPKPAALAEAVTDVTVYQAITLHQKMYFYSWKWVQPKPWPGPVVTMYKWIVMPQLGPQYFRDRRGGFDHIRDGGWHLSYFGGSAAAAKKLSSTPHTELDIDKAIAELDDSMARGLEPFRRPTEVLVETDGTDEIAALG